MPGPSTFTKALPGQRRAVLRLLGTAGVVSVLSGLTGCGFKLRGSQTFAFKTIVITPAPGGAVAQQLRRSFGSDVKVLAAADSLSNQAQLVLDVGNEQREKVVVGVNTTGQVREFQLRLRVTLQLRNAQGNELIAGDEILQRRDMSYNETAALAKESEEILVFRDMQSDIVQQILRRLAAVQTSQLN
jgi:LPS-assembly lipoprotein